MLPRVLLKIVKEYSRERDNDKIRRLEREYKDEQIYQQHYNEWLKKSRV
jgi:hypothetical protein